MTARFCKVCAYTDVDYHVIQDRVALDHELVFGTITPNLLVAVLVCPNAYGWDMVCRNVALQNFPRLPKIQLHSIRHKPSTLFERTSLTP